MTPPLLYSSTELFKKKSYIMLDIRQMFGKTDFLFHSIFAHVQNEEICRAIF